jgi:hypothetical protein
VSKNWLAIDRLEQPRQTSRAAMAGDARQHEPENVDDNPTRPASAQVDVDDDVDDKFPHAVRVLIIAILAFFPWFLIGGIWWLLH